MKLYKVYFTANSMRYMMYVSTDSTNERSILLRALWSIGICLTRDVQDSYVELCCENI